MAAASVMKARSKFVQVSLLVTAYLFAVYAAGLVFSREAEMTSGYRYLLLLTAVLLLLAAHGFGLIRNSQIRRLDETAQGTVRDVTTDVTLSVWEILFGWLGVIFALTFLYYAAPPEQLSDWHPRLFLCLVVFFGAMYQRALIFVYCLLPFLFTMTALELWQGWGVESPAESAAKAIFLALNLALLWWSARLSRAHGIFAVSELEMPLGPGHLPSARRDSKPATGHAAIRLPARPELHSADPRSRQACVGRSAVALPKGRARRFAGRSF